MKPVRSLLVVALAAALAPSPSAQSAAIRPVQTDEGRVVIHFLDDMLIQNDLELFALQETAATGTSFEEAMDGDLMGFNFSDQEHITVLQGRDGEFIPYGVIGGKVTVDGGFMLTSTTTGRTVDFTGFSLAPYEVRSDGPGGEVDPDYFFLSADDGTDEADFLLCYVKVFFKQDEAYSHAEPDRLRIKAWDLVVTPALAEKLARPDLIGATLGYGKLDASYVVSTEAWEHPEGQNMFTPNVRESEQAGFEGTLLDVKLGILSSITQLGHVGSFPNGRAGLSMATTSCNVGDVNAVWLAAMNEDHPGIAMQLHRDLNGRFEQVGTSWIKHGFFALSNSQCTPCQNPSGGTFLGVGCSDTYGSSNNGDRFWLGPRDEWDPNEGTWTCEGSYFDGTPVDCIRSTNGSGNGSVNHRLEAFDADLNNPGATYYYEAFYMVNSDQKLDNNIGSRRCTMSWNGNKWNFSTPSASNSLIEGPAIERWADADMISRAAFKGDGTVIVAVNTTDLGNGFWRYEYAVMNWTVNRRFRSFSVPSKGALVDPYFHDIDNQAANDWETSTLGANAKWEFNDVMLAGHKVGGPIELATIYNFGFTSKRPPAMRDAVMRVQNDGPGGVLIGIETLAPADVALSASNLSPKENTTINLEVRGGQFGAMVGVIAVAGIPIDPFLVTPSPVPFVGDLAEIPLFIPAGLSGLDFDMIAADFDTSVERLSNLMTLIIE
ncbi:MAG: hypothetical protein DRQ55_10100 [Planctomycetota bacterium]|nr:MAG: hypothetical protein DRQ55_10100 [Planctomycetota bacterium]